MLRPLPLTGRGGAGIVASINYVVAHPVRTYDDAMARRRRNSSAPSNGREEEGEEIGGGSATARRS